MSTLPSGTVTYLFTDIEGSTRLLHDLGDRYADVLAAHHRILRSAFEASGGREIHADAVRALGVIAEHEGDLTRARALLEKGLAFFRETRNRRFAAQTLDALGAVERRQGDAQRARTLHQEALALHRDMGDKRGIAESLEGLAAVAVSQQRFDRAGALFGAAEALRDAIGAPLPPAERPDYEDSVNAARAGLGEEALRGACARGRGMRLEDAIAVGLQDA